MSNIDQDCSKQQISEKWDASRETQELPHNRPIRKAFYLGTGFVLVGIGFLGMILPILPGIPFFVAALFCFERSSHRMRQWLLQHPWIGPGLTDWHQRGAISRKLKFVSLVMMAAAVPVISALAVPIAAKITAMVALSIAAIFILSRPHS